MKPEPMQITIQLPRSATDPDRLDLLKGLSDDAKENGESLQAIEIPDAEIRAFSGPDPNLLSLALSALHSLDPGSTAAGAAAGGLGVQSLKRMIPRLVAFARKFQHPLQIKIGKATVELPPTATPAEITRVVEVLTRENGSKTAAGGDAVGTRAKKASPPGRPAAAAGKKRQQARHTP